MTKIMAVQTSIRKFDLVSSDSIESHIRRTSGRANSCDNRSVSHLGNLIDSKIIAKLMLKHELLPKRKILRLDVLVYKFGMNLGIHVLDFVHKPLHHTIDSTFCFVQGLDEKISNVRHKICEAEKRVCFSMFCNEKHFQESRKISPKTIIFFMLTSPIIVRIRSKDIIDWPYYFIHALNVTLTRV